MGGGSTQVSDLQGYCTHSGCQEGRPRESARGSVRERMGAWSVRGARAGGEARAYRVHDLPFVVRQFVPRDNTLAACTPRRAFVALLPERCTRAVASVATSILSRYKSAQTRKPNPRLSRDDSTVGSWWSLHRPRHRPNGTGLSSTIMAAPPGGGAAPSTRAPDHLAAQHVRVMRKRA